MDEDLKLCEKLSANGTRRRRLNIQQFILQYVQVALGQEWPGRITFNFLIGGFHVTQVRLIITQVKK